MRPKFLFMVFMGFVLPASAQRQEDLSARPLKTDSTDIYVHLLDDDKPLQVDVCSTCVYHWVKGGKVQHTRGGYDGKILHGLYTEYYRKGNLKERGMFRKGLKCKEWRTWFENGELQSQTCYKEGKADGESLQYDATGILRSRMNYKNGMLNGKQIHYEDSTTRIEHYSKDVLISSETERKEAIKSGWSWPWKRNKNKVDNQEREEDELKSTPDDDDKKKGDQPIKEDKNLELDKKDKKQELKSPHTKKNTSNTQG